MSDDNEDGRRERRKPFPRRWWIIEFLNRLRLVEEIIELPEEDWHEKGDDDE